MKRESMLCFMLLLFLFIIDIWYILLFLYTRRYCWIFSFVFFRIDDMTILTLTRLIIAISLLQITPSFRLSTASILRYFQDIRDTAGRQSRRVDGRRCWCPTFSLLPTPLLRFPPARHADDDELPFLCCAGLPFHYFACRRPLLLFILRLRPPSRLSFCHFHAMPSLPPPFLFAMLVLFYFIDRLSFLSDAFSCLCDDYAAVVLFLSAGFSFLFFLSMPRSRQPERRCLTLFPLFFFFFSSSFSFLSFFLHFSFSSPMPCFFMYIFVEIDPIICHAMHRHRLFAFRLQRIEKSII